MPTEKTTKGKEYIEAIGRRKTAIARVRIFPKGTGFTVNDRALTEFFPVREVAATATAALVKINRQKDFGVTAHVKGGGQNAQADAIRLGVARALIAHEEGLRAELKPLGFLKRDPRAVERKHFGKKKARRAPQWAKR